MKVPQPPAALVEALLKAQSVSLVTHVRPDGDGLGCEGALALALRSLGKDVLVANEESTPSLYGFLGLDAFAQGSPEGRDLAVALDCPDLERLGPKGAAAFTAAKTGIVIDHHVPRTPFGAAVWIDEKAAATGELVEALLPALGVRTTPAMADCLYAALVHDTGCFRHSNTDARVLGTAARLLEAGADGPAVVRRLMDSRPLRMVRLQSRALAGLKTFCGGAAALVTVSAADLADFGATWEDTEGLSESVRSIEGVEVAAMLREEGPLAAKLSLRSKSAVDVNALAGRWSGGGHVRAAGATLRMAFPEAAVAVAEALAGLGLEAHSAA